jgi:hypothetical protein
MTRRARLAGNKNVGRTSAHRTHAIGQDARRPTGRTRSGRTHVGPQDARDRAGRTSAHRTHTRGVPTMDGGGVCVGFRVEPRRVGAWTGWMRAAPRPRSMSPPATTPPLLSRSTVPTQSTPSIVGTLLARVLPDRVRPPCSRASSLLARVLPACPRPVRRCASCRPCARTPASTPASVAWDPPSFAP